jgi:hypothetical protein
VIAGTARFVQRGIKRDAHGVKAFTRSDPTPHIFQPLRVTSRGNVGNDGGISTLTFDLENQDSVYRCYGSDMTVPDGWT